MIEPFDPKLHWDKVYSTKPANGVSWYQETSDLSLALIERAVTDKSAQIIDVGSGATQLISALLKRGFESITALDISETALAIARQQLHTQSAQVQWITANICKATLPHQYDVWHDRAVFHFLNDAQERIDYL